MVPDDFVGGAGAVGDKKAVVGIENSRGVALALTNGPVVVEQLAQLFHCVAHVGTQHVFTKKLVKHLTNRAL